MPNPLTQTDAGTVLHDEIKAAYRAGAEDVLSEWKEVCECAPLPEHAGIGETSHTYWNDHGERIQEALRLTHSPAPSSDTGKLVEAQAIIGGLLDLGFQDALVTRAREWLTTAEAQPWSILLRRSTPSEATRNEVLETAIIGARMILEGRARAATDCLAKPGWRPDRAHIEGCRNAMVEAIEELKPYSPSIAALNEAEAPRSGEA